MEQRLTSKFQKLIGTSVFPQGVFYEGRKFEHPDAQTRSQRGVLFALQTLVGPKDLDAVVFGQAIFDSLEDDYFGNQDLPPLAALEKAALLARRRLTDMALAAHLGTEVEFSLLLAVLWGKVLYLCRLGEGAVYLLRDGRVSEVFLGQPSAVICGSGFVYDGDSLILGSPDFRNQFPVSQMESSLPSLEEKMHDLSSRFRLAAIILKFEVEEMPGALEAIKFVRPAGAPAAGQVLSPFLNFLRKLRRLWSRPLPVGSVDMEPRSSRRAPRRWPRFRLGLVVLLVALLFVGSVFWTIRRSRTLKLNKLTQQTLSQVEEDLVSATDLVNLNNLSAQDDLEKILGSLKNLDDLGVKDPRIDQYRQQAQKLLFQVAKVTNVKPRLLYDFELSQKGIGKTITNLAGSNGNLFVGDKALGAVWQLKIGSPLAASRIDQGQLKDIVRLAAFGDRLSVLTTAGVAWVDLKKGTVGNNVVPDLKTSEISEFINYNGNLYFLDIPQNQIQKAAATDAGFGRLVGYLKEAVNLDKTQSLNVNGFVFLRRSDGTIIKFDGGHPSDFHLSGYKGTFSPSFSLYTGTNLSDLYIIDAPAKRLYKFSDTGVYQKTYDFNSSGITAFDSFYVDDSSGKLYLLSASKVYELEP